MEKPPAGFAQSEANISATFAAQEYCTAQIYIAALPKGAFFHRAAGGIDDFSVT
jgi:hypothetical protein